MAFTLAGSAQAAEPVVLPETAVDAVSERTGTPTSDLEVVHESVATYDALGERYYDAKVRDDTDGSVHVVRIDEDGNSVDKEATRERARRAHREEYGRLDGQLRRRLEEAAADEEVAVSVWTDGVDRAGARRTVGFEKRPNESAVREALSAEIQDRIEARTERLGRAIDAIDGATVVERERGAPVVHATATPGAIDRIQRLEPVWLVLNRHTGPDHPDLEEASKTHESFAERNDDYDATGYKVGVFEVNGITETDYVNREKLHDDSDPSDTYWHAHRVSMCAASTDDDQPGIAANADVYAAHSTSVKQDDKISWFASEGVPVVNNSWSGSEHTDRDMTSRDFMYDQYIINKGIQIVHSAGNYGTNSTYDVNSPARGFNTVTAGAYDDNEDPDDQDVDEPWSGSCYVDPHSEHDEHDKPEVCGIGAGIDFPNGVNAKNGTSYSAPHVSGLITLLQKFGDDYGRTDLDRPEVNKAITMASTSEDGDWTFDEAGLGTIRASYAEDIVERGWYVSDTIKQSDGNTSYHLGLGMRDPITIVLTWLTDVTESDFQDVSNARSDVDLDLTVWGPGASVVASSHSADRGYEWVRFNPSAPGSYTIQVNNVDWESSDTERELALAWHRPAMTSSGGLVLNDYDGDPAWSGENDLGNWCGAGSLDNGGGDGEVIDGALRLEYDTGGWFKSDVNQDVSDYEYLQLRVRGDDGGEESDFTVSLGGVEDTLDNLTIDSIGTSYSVVMVNLENNGMDASNPGTLEFDFWKGESNSGAVEIDEIWFGDPFY